MKPKIRYLWMQIHTYFACFFLPITILYVVSGVLYEFGIEGGVKEEFEYTVSFTKGWPQTEEEAFSLVSSYVTDNNHGTIPPDYYSEPEYISWYGYKQEILLVPTDDEQQGKLMVLKHDFMHQLLLIHKGHAGIFFWFFSIMLGASLLMSLISGLIISLTVPKFRRISIITTGLGLLTLLSMFVISG